MGRGARLDRLAIGLLAFVLAAGPIAAQGTAPVTNNSAAPSEIIGPPQLRDFNLNGTVTRQAAPPATTRAAPPPAAGPVETAPARQQGPGPRSRTVEPQAERASPIRQAPSVALPEPSAPGPAADLQAVDRAPVAVAPPMPLPGESGSGFIYWPWLLAGLAAAGGALLLFRRHQQQRDRYAEALAGYDLGTAPEPAAEPLRRAPVPAPPPKPASTGVVSTRLRPDIVIDLLPERAVIDETGATIEFQVAVRNNGTTPAREVQIEACMINAGPSQDQELGDFFAHPAAKGEAIPQIMPMTEILLKSAVRLPPEHMRQYEFEGRKLFVPLVGVNAVYRGPAGPKQTSASYLVGRDGDGEKMAPFRLDLGPRIFRGLGARTHTLGLRK